MSAKGFAQVVRDSGGHTASLQESSQEDLGEDTMGYWVVLQRVVPSQSGLAGPVCSLRPEHLERRAGFA
jgi:hypothetical protein